MFEHLKGMAQSMAGMFAEISAYGVIVVMVSIMLLLGIADLSTFYARGLVRHRDFKTIIVSLGILGTFIGVSHGLYGFDTEDIEGGVPQLLNGLKVAFVTSVVGMALSIFLAVLQRTTDTSQAGTEEERMKDIVEEIKLMRKDIQNGFSGSVTAMKSVSGDVRELREGMKTVNRQMEEGNKNVHRLVREEFAKVNTTLAESLKKISEGANKEIIEILNKSIQGFNENLTEQFGENFKRLNEACLKLVEWQEKHKEDVELVHRQLESTVAAIQGTRDALDTIAKRNAETMEAYEKIRIIIQTYDNQTTALTSHLEKYGKLADKAGKMFEDTNMHFHDVAKIFEKFASEADARFQEITSRLFGALDRITENAESGTETLIKSVSQKFAGLLAEIEQGTTRLTQSLSEDMQTFMGEISGNLKAATDSISAVLVGISESAMSHSTAIQSQHSKLSLEAERITDETMRGMSEKARVAFEEVGARFENIAGELKAFADSLNNALGEHSKKMAGTLEEAGRLIEAMSGDLRHEATKMQESLTNQSQEIESMLKKQVNSLNEMENVFVSITKQLGEDYETFIKAAATMFNERVKR